MLLKLLALPVTAPIAGIRFCLDQVVEAAEQEWLDEGPVKEALQLAALQLDEGEISVEQYGAQEAVLLRRLREIRAWKQGRLPDEAGQPMVISMQGGNVVVDLGTSLDADGPSPRDATHG